MPAKIRVHQLKFEWDMHRPDVLRVEGAIGEPRDLVIPSALAKVPSRRRSDGGGSGSDADSDDGSEASTDFTLFVSDDDRPKLKRKGKGRGRASAPAWSSQSAGSSRSGLRRKWASAGNLCARRRRVPSDAVGCRCAQGRH